MPLTEDQKIRRRAEQKAARLNDKATTDIPLFADQVEDLTTPEEEYRKARLSWALAPRGEEAAYLAGIDWKWDVWLLRRVAQTVMSPKDFAVAVAKDRQHGDQCMFWKNVLTGRQRLVLSYWRHVYGCRESTPYQHYDGPTFTVEKRIAFGEELVWPPPGWSPPLTNEEVEALISIPPALDHPGAVDPFKLAITTKQGIRP